MTLKIGFSTCPNDTFIFDAMVHHKIDTEGLDFDVVLADVEELNKSALENTLDITKLSYHAYAYVAQNYRLLTAGSALGNNNGPLLVSKYKIYPDEVKDVKIAIPGKYTTANLLLGIAFPNAVNKKEYLFSDIEEAVLSNEVDAGVIIHENRFTYEERGLKKISDLGEFWEAKTSLPIPLGGIVVKRSLPEHHQITINRVLRRSIEYAFANPESGERYIRQHAQEMKTEVLNKHINLFVNQQTLRLGKKGKDSIKKLYETAEELEIIPKMRKDIFVE